MALTGENFCASTKSVYFTLLKNALRYTLVEGLGHLLILIGTIAIASSSTYIGYLIITRSARYNTILNDPIFPTIVKLYLYFNNFIRPL